MNVCGVSVSKTAQRFRICHIAVTAMNAETTKMKEEKKAPAQNVPGIMACCRYLITADAFDDTHIHNYMSACVSQRIYPVAVWPGHLPILFFWPLFAIFHGTLHYGQVADVTHAAGHRVCHKFHFISYPTTNKYSFETKISRWLNWVEWSEQKKNCLLAVWQSLQLYVGFFS